MESNFNKYMELSNSKSFSIATFQRLFKWSFPKAKSLMEELIKYGAIEKGNDNYKIADIERFKLFGINLFLYDDYNYLSKSLSIMILEKLIEDDRFIEKVNKEFKLNIDIENTSKKQRQESINLLLSNTARRFILEKLAIDFIDNLYNIYAPHILDKYWFDWLNKNCPT